MEQKDLEYFRECLLKELDEIQKKGENTLEDMSNQSAAYADPADRASHESDQAFTLRLRDRDRKLIKKINEALGRIEDGTYGICEECGEEISISRLKARPVTTLCIDCKSKQEEEEQLLKS
jgi:DnaK suppressor protein